MTTKDKLNLELAFKMIADKFNEKPGPKVGILFDKNQKDTVWLTEERMNPMHPPRKIAAAQWLEGKREKEKTGWALAFSLELLPSEISYITLEMGKSKYVGKDIIAGSTYFIDDDSFGLRVNEEAFSLFAGKLMTLAASQAADTMKKYGLGPKESYEDEPDAGPTPTPKKPNKEDMN
jgi:hypothetical protein